MGGRRRKRAEGQRVGTAERRGPAKAIFEDRSRREGSARGQSAQGRRIGSRTGGDRNAGAPDFGPGHLLLVFAALSLRGPRRRPETPERRAAKAARDPSHRLRSDEFAHASRPKDSFPAESSYPNRLRNVRFFRKISGKAKETDWCEPKYRGPRLPRTRDLRADHRAAREWVFCGAPAAGPGGSFVPPCTQSQDRRTCVALGFRGSQPSDPAPTDTRTPSA